MNEEQVNPNNVFLSNEMINQIIKEFGCSKDYIEQVFSGIRHDPRIKAHILLLQKNNVEDENNE